MIVPGEVNRRLELARPYVAHVEERVRDNIFKFCDTSGYAFLGRAKTAESLTEKLETGRYATWGALDDLYACAIIVPELGEELSVRKFLSERFDVTGIRARGDSLKDPAVFRFDATRVIAKLRSDALLTDDSPLRGVRFEIQIRTAFEHAWSVTTHSRAYKAGGVDWKRLRLAAQMKAAVEQLDSLIVAFDAATSSLSEHKWPDVAAMRIIEMTFRELLDDGFLPPEVAPASWMRFCENILRVIVGSAGSFVKAREKEERVKIAMQFIREAVRDAGSDKHPRSLSLVQFTLGTLVQADRINKPIKDYTPLVTQEMLDLFPKAKALGAGFQFETP